jgi:hypothetical protein
MIDTSDGQTRIRKWPRPRGKAKTPEQRESEEFFRQCQMAARYIAPTIMADFIDARKGTPILPRDILTAMLAQTLIAPILDDGRKLYPMAYKTQVSDALDAITQTEGQTLVRGPEFWEPQPYNPGGGGSAAWSLAGSWTWSSNVPSVVIPDLGGFADLLIFGYNITLAVSGQRILHASTNNGSSWFTTSGNYATIPANGVLANDTSLTALHATAATAARSGLSLIRGNNLPGVPKLCESLNRQATDGVQRLFLADLVNPINALRLTGTAGGNITGGSLFVLGR